MLRLHNYSYSNQLLFLLVMILGVSHNLDSRAFAVAGEAALRGFARPYEGDWAPVYGLQFSQDGKLLAVGRGAYVYLLDGQTYRLLRKIEARPRGRVWAIALSPDGKAVAASTYVRDEPTPQIGLWNTENGNRIWLQDQLPGDRRVESRSLDFSPCGKQIAAEHSRQVKLIDAETGRIARTFELADWPEFAGSFQRVRFMSKEQVWAFTDRSLVVWNPKNGEMLHSQEGIEGAAWFGRGEVSAKQSRVLVGMQGYVHIIDSGEWELVRRIEFDDAVNSWDVTIHPGKGLGAHASRSLRLFRLRDGILLGDVRVTVGPETVGALAFSPDGERVAVGDDMGWVRVLSVERIMGQGIMADGRDWGFSSDRAQEMQRTAAQRIDQDVEFANSVGMKLRLIPAGTFVRGSPVTEDNRSIRERQHRVTLTDPFRIGTTEVTQSQWKEVMGRHNNPSEFIGDRLPVHNVTWREAVEFCRRLTERERLAGRIGREQSYRLPTEAEWEWAARAGTVTAFFTGDDETRLGNAAWYHGNSDGRPHPVGSKTPNAWGLFDMHGNVWEFCSDYWDDYPCGEVRNPSGPERSFGRVIRGGSWDDASLFSRSAARASRTANSRSNGLGFRVVLDVE